MQKGDVFEVSYDYSLTSRKDRFAPYECDEMPGKVFLIKLSKKNKGKKKKNQSVLPHWGNWRVEAVSNPADINKKDKRGNDLFMVFVEAKKFLG